MYLFYSWTILITSAYTNASTLYGECTSVSWTIFRVISAYTLQCIYFIYTVNVPRLAGLEFRITSAYIPMHLLYTVNVPLLAGLYSGLPQRIPMNLLYTVNVPLLAGLYSGLPQRIPMHLLYTVNVPSC